MGLTFSTVSRLWQQGSPFCRILLVSLVSLASTTLVSAATKQLTVNWDDTEAEDGYRVERSVDGVNFGVVATLPANSTSYTDVAILAGTTYWYRVMAFNATATSPYSNTAFATTEPEILATGTHTASRLANLSVRAVAGTGDGTLIVGFVIGGSAKNMLVRAIGPGIAEFAASTTPDPSLALMNGLVSLASNDNWGGTAELKSTFSRLGALPLADSSLDAALLRVLDPQPYTVIVSGDPGVALAEIYDADLSNAPSGRLKNVSARARAEASDGVLIVGFVISGDSPLPVLIRAVGPSLISAGVSGALANPQLSLFRGQVPLKYNDDWAGDATLAAAFAATGASNFADVNSKDAAIFSSLPPGAYTAIISGVGSTSGIALAEVYELP